MKIFFALNIFLLTAFTPLSASGATRCNNPDLVPIQDAFNRTSQFCSVNSAIITVINIILGVIALVAVLMIVIGGFKYVISSGNPEAVKSATKTITWAVIGLVVAVLAYAIVSIVSNTISSDPNPSAPAAQQEPTQNQDSSVLP